MKHWALGMLLVCTVPAHAAAQPAAWASQTDGAVIVQFRPPVGKELRYQVTASEKPSVQRLSLRFERSGDGFLMHAANQIPDENRSAVLEIALAQPATFTVSADGKITGIVDEANYWRRVEASLQSSKEPANILASTSKFVQTVRAMPSQQRALIAGKPYRQVFGWIGTQRSAKRIDGNVVPISMDVTASSDTVTIVWNVDMSRFIAKLNDEMRARAVPNNGWAESKVAYGATERAIVDRTTGLLIRSDLTETRVRAGKPVRSVKTISLLPENS